MDSEAIVRERDHIFSKLYYFYDKHDKSKLDFGNPDQVIEMVRMCECYLFKTLTNEIQPQSKTITLVLNQGFAKLNEQLDAQYSRTIKEDEYDWPIKHEIFHQRNKYYVILLNYNKKNRAGLVVTSTVSSLVHPKSRIDFSSNGALTLSTILQEFETLISYAIEKGVAALNNKLVSKFGARLDF